MKASVQRTCQPRRVRLCRSSRLDQHRSKGLLSPFSTGLTFLLISPKVSRLLLHSCTTRRFPPPTKTLQPPSLVPRGDFPAFRVPLCPKSHLPPPGPWFLDPSAVSSVTRELVLQSQWSLLARGTTDSIGSDIHAPTGAPSAQGDFTRTATSSDTLTHTLAPDIIIVLSKAATKCTLGRTGSPGT